MDCPRCTRLNPRQANFCLHCGERLTGARIGERKQVTVLFADTVRSTELVGKLGPEAFRELMNELFALARSEVERFGGTVNQLLGDGFMALFGAVAAHEDHTRRAVLATEGLRARIRDTLAPRGVELRLGMASGLAVIDTMGAGGAATVTAFGEVTVLAARLQALAEPGQVLLTAADADRVRGFADLAAAGEFLVDGAVVRVESLQAVDERRAGSHGRQRVLAPFVGRTAEFDALLRLLPGVESGHGRAVHVVGDPGVGKSRLVLEFVRTGTVRVVEGRCVSYGTAMPYLPIAELVRDACCVRPDDTAPVAVEKVRSELARVGIEDGATPLLFDLVGRRHGLDTLSGLDPATIKGRTFDALRHFWRAESRVHPLVLVVEDLHWIDRTSEELLAALLEDIDRERLMLVITYRPGYSPPWATNPRVHVLQLAALDEDASRTILAAAVPRTLEPTRLDAIITRAEGNPFFLEELARAAADDGAQDVPRTVQDVLAARLERLGDAPKHVAQTASVLGREFSLRVLRALWDGRTSLRALLRQLEHLGVLARTRRNGVRGYAFRHALTQEVAYASLLERHRRNLHGRAAAVLEESYADELEERCELIAHHYARSDNVPKAARFLVMANRKAASRNAMEEALAYFYQALQALEALDDNDANRRKRLQLLFAQTGEFHFLHRHQEYHDLIVAHEPLVRAVGDEELQGAFDARLGHRQWTMGQIALSVDTLERAARTCARVGNDEHGASAHAILAWAHLMCGNYAEVPRARDRALELLERRFDPVWYSFACAAATLACTWCGRWSDAIDEGATAVRHGRARGDRAIVSFNTSWMAHAYLLRCDWAKARDHALVALDEAPTIYFRGFPQAMLARAMCGLGKASEGLATLKEIEPLVRASGHSSAWALMAGFLGEAHLEVGDAASARATLESVNAVCRAGPMSFMRARSSRLLGQIALDERRYDDARRWLGDALGEARRSGALDEVALAAAVQGRLEALDG